MRNSKIEFPSLSDEISIVSGSAQETSQLSLDFHRITFIHSFIRYIEDSVFPHSDFNVLQASASKQPWLSSNLLHLLMVLKVRQAWICKFLSIIGLLVRLLV